MNRLRGNKKLCLDKLKEMRGMAKNTSLAPLKNTEFVKAEENDNKSGSEDKSMTVAADEKGSKRTLGYYKRKYGFSPKQSTKRPVRSSQNMSALSMSRNAGR